MKYVMIVLALCTLAACGADGDPIKPEAKSEQPSQ